jgi:hypothetical protein
MRGAIFAIVAVAFTTAAIVWGSLHVIHEAERMQRDAKLLRRRFLFLGAIYACSASCGVFQVATGQQPPLALIGVAVAGAFAWFLIRGASKAKTNTR